MDFTKLSFLIGGLKDTMNKVQRQPAQWRCYFQIIYLIKIKSRICKELLKLTSSNNNKNLIQKHARNLNKYFSRKDIHMANNIHMKRW